MKKKTRTTRVYNPELDEYEWREVETDKYVFDETDRIAIAREYYERGCPASEIVSKYHLSSAVVLYGWLDKYLNEKVCVSLPPETYDESDMSKKSKQQLEEELKTMKAENKRLQEALRMALATLPEGDAPYLTHHSDRGCQYCSRTYVDTLKSRKIQISMTQSGDPLENAVAERANGILKSEWLYHMDPPSEKECKSVVSRIIDFYNNERPHMKNGCQPKQ